MDRSSTIVLRALGWAPDGVPAKKEGTCAYCGQPIHVGDLHVRFSAGPAFMDDLSLADRGSGMTCGYCVPLLSRDGLMASGYGVFSERGGVTPFRKWADIAAALREPPEPPFVAVYATANNQHMAWRAPVNLSRDLFYIRVGLRDLKIRRPMLLDAVGQCQKIGEFMRVPPTPKSLSHPFVVLSSDLKDGQHTRLRYRGPKEDDPSLEDAMAALPDAFSALFNLTLGESWGLRFLLSPGAGTSSDD